MFASEDRRDGTGGEPGGRAARTRMARRGTVVERLSRYGMQVMPSAFQRSSRQRRRPEEVNDSSASTGLQREAPERTSLTPAMRKTYLKELFLSAPSHSGFSAVLSAQSQDIPPEQDADWGLYPREHAWMLSAVDGNYETILEFISNDPLLLSRKDFISGFTVLHWLAKRGQDETLLKLVRYAERVGIPVNVNVRGSGGMTPLHVASMQRHYSVVKVLVGAFGASVDVMDYNGRRAWQYLPGDAPPAMQELLGMWDDEHRWTCARNVNNNNCSDSNCCSSSSSSVGSGPAAVTGQDEPDQAGSSEVTPADGADTAGGWMIGSLRKMLPSLPFLRNKK